MRRVSVLVDSIPRDRGRKIGSRAGSLCRSSVRRIRKQNWAAYASNRFVRVAHDLVLHFKKHITTAQQIPRENDEVDIPNERIIPPNASLLVP